MSSNHSSSTIFSSLLALLLIVTSAIPANAAILQFRNCLDRDIVNTRNPQLLQFVPLSVGATFNTTSDAHNLNITIHGNVTGQAVFAPYPSPDDPSWTNPNDTFGKIPDISQPNNKFTTLFTRFDVLSYTPYNAPASQFCEALTQGECPLGPVFNVNATDVSRLPAFSVAHDMYSSYAFTSITATMRVQSGDASGIYYGCISTTITPELGSSLSDLLRYLPLAILILVGIATISAAIFSPWGSSDIFDWSSNFGRDEDLLRLVTPGFADCLQYIQFIVLTGSLSLNYPGFYQPVVSRVAWSALMFNESFVTNGNGTQSLVDGIYQLRNQTNDGLDRMSQYVGMTSTRDMWAGMIIWIVVIIVAAAVLTQLAFVARWIYRRLASVPAEDLRSKNVPFTVGNIVRVALNYFLLPLLTLSFYQLVIASRGPTYSVALAAIVIIAIVLFAGRLLLLFIRTRPKSVLYDDLITLLTYGPLYNTYCDDAAVYAFIPIAINFLRAIAIGAVQPSGVAQVVLLAISEIIILLTINTFRPYPSATSMNIYHTCFSLIRLLTILLSIAFVPSLEVADSSRGWIGYAILLVHACVLVFGFFLNAIQTLIEVLARLAGAGGSEDASGAAARGGLVKVFGMRQLSRRLPRHDHNSRQSMGSNAAMLNAMEKEQKDIQLARTRSRSVSASSTMLLDNQQRNAARHSQNLEGFSPGETTPDQASILSKGANNRLSTISAGGGGIIGLQNSVEARDPYYRPPRRNTMDPMTDKPHKGSLTNKDKNGVIRGENALDDDSGEGSSTPARGDKEEFEDVSNELTKTKTDYAVREVDFYYGVRGPALSSGTRKLKTGPADPTGPVSSATGWFKGLLGGKSKEKNKGFEVVRSSRVPPGMMPPPLDEENRGIEPYHDNAALSKDARGVRSPPRINTYSDDNAIQDDSDDERTGYTPVAKLPPSLPHIDTLGAIELPSRIGSQASRKPTKRPAEDLPPLVPPIPRKSSRRESGDSFYGKRLSVVPATPPNHRDSAATTGSGRIPFVTPPGRPASHRPVNSVDRAAYVQPHSADEENIPPPQPYADLIKRTSSALGHHAADDRPSSVGFVQQHRASDNIHYSPDSAEFEGSTAEVLGKPSKAFA